MQTKRKQYPICDSPLFKLGNRRKLAELLAINNADLRRLGKRSENLYSEFEVPKKNGGRRGVENPRRDLKIVQARLARLLCRIAPPDYLFCPVKRRCYVTNAAEHRGQRVIHSLDIQRYYPNTPARRVNWFFRKVMKCTPDIAGLLTSLATYREHLPTGSPLSPILAFFAFYDLWEGIAILCEEQGLILTVYVDDITISGQYIDGSLLWRIRQAIFGVGLRYHKEKHYVDRPAEVTGTIVTKSGVAAPSRQFKKLHDARVALRKTPDVKSANLLEGKIKGLNAQLAQIQKVQDRLPKRLAVTSVTIDG